MWSSWAYCIFRRSMKNYSTLSGLDLEYMPTLLSFSQTLIFSHFWVLILFVDVCDLLWGFKPTLAFMTNFQKYVFGIFWNFQCFCVDPFCLSQFVINYPTSTLFMPRFGVHILKFRFSQTSILSHSLCRSFSRMFAMFCVVKSKKSPTAPPF